MRIFEIKENKKEYLDLLLLADEQEDMIDRYLHKGTMYVLEDHGIKAECVVTGDSPLTVPFYEKSGFIRSHVIPDFFTENYDHLIYEGGVQLVDMVYLQRKFCNKPSSFQTKQLVL